MPTAAKLIAGLWFALLAWFCAELTKNYLPEATRIGYFTQISAVLGFLVGWVFMGKRAGDTMGAAYGYGFSGAVLVAFWCVFYFSFEAMIMRSLDNRYDGPSKALVGMVDLFKDNALYILKLDVAGALIVGGLFGGWLTENVARRWS